MNTDLHNERSSTPRIRTAQIRLLERLCNACGVSGDEGEVRSIVLEQIRPHADEIKVDALGNVLAVRRAHSFSQGTKPMRVMVTAHMDEVGVMIIHDEGDGLFRFSTVGGIETSSLAGKPVWIGRSHLPGIVGVNPVHLISSDEIQRIPALDSLRIDVSPDSAKKVKIGDRATFGSPFLRLGPSICAKALDDRIGVATLIELFRNAPPRIELLAAFTVQEEIGLVGAHVAAFALNPDVAFVLDCTPAQDLPVYDDSRTGSLDDENTFYNTRLGAGPAIYTADGATISDPRLISHLIRTGEALGIPYQLRQPGSGGTDAGAIHKQRLGIPTVSLSVPGRYAHTGTMIVRLHDWKNTLALIYHALNHLTPEILAPER